MRLYTVTFLCAMLSLCFSVQSRSQAVDIERGVLAAARRDAPGFLALIPEGRESEFGFSYRHEIAGATIGEAYRVLTISPSFFRGEPVPAGKELVDAGEWWVTVRNRERLALVMVVSLVESDWQVVAMGMTRQAAELGSFEKSRHARQGGTNILRIYPAQADFILSSSDGNGSTTVHPMMTARLAFPGMADKSPFSMEEMVQWLRLQYMLF